jgi:glycerophosphoryl diester phosphodiesterase
MFLKIGHRGARAYEIENTLASFRRAIELGVNALELDVRLSKDRKLVVSHDDNLKRVFGKDMPVKEATLEELRESTGRKMVTLDEALEFIDGKVEKILVELKETGYEERVMDVLKREQIEQQIILTSFHEDALRIVRQRDGKIDTGLIYARLRKPIDLARELKCQYIIPLYRFVHRRDVEEAHKSGLRVIVWTINTAEEVREFIVRGVDGIASDRPDIFSGIA